MDSIFYVPMVVRSIVHVISRFLILLAIFDFTKESPVPPTPVELAARDTSRSRPIHLIQLLKVCK